MLLQMTLFHYFLWLSNIPSYMCTAASLSVHLLMGIRLMPCLGSHTHIFKGVYIQIWLQFFGAAVTKYRRVAPYNWQDCISYSSGVWKPDVSCQHGQLRGVFQVCFLLVSSHGKRGEGAPEGFFYKALILFMRAPLSWRNHLPKASPLNTIT